MADLIGELVQANDVDEAVNLMTIAYGKQYAEEYEERIQLLFGMILEDGWSKKRFMDTLKFLIKTRPYRDWTISDFISAPTAMLVSYEKAGKGFVPYRVGKFILWAEPHVEVPFEKVVSPKYAHMEPVQYSGEPVFENERVRQMFLNAKRQVKEASEYLSDREIERRKQEAKMSLENLPTGDSQ